RPSGRGPETPDDRPRQSLRDAARLVRHLGARLGAFSPDLARDVGAVARDAQAFADAAIERATLFKRATPRALRLAQAGASVLARRRLLRLAGAARGDDRLRDEDHRELARRTTELAAEL